MKTARTSTTTATWWSRQDSVFTTTTRPPAVPPAPVWPTGRRASWGADNTPAPPSAGQHHRLPGGFSSAPGWLLLHHGPPGPGTTNQLSHRPCLRWMHPVVPRGFVHRMFESHSWSSKHHHVLIFPSLDLAPINGALWKPSSGKYMELSACSHLVPSSQQMGRWLSAARSLVLLAFLNLAPWRVQGGSAPNPAPHEALLTRVHPSVTSAQLCLFSFSKTLDCFPAVWHKYLTWILCFI